MKDKLKNVDWASIGVLGVSVAATVVKSLYDKKRFDENLNKQYLDHFEEKVSKIVDKKLKNNK